MGGPAGGTQLVNESENIDEEHPPPRSHKTRGPDGDGKIDSLDFVTLLDHLVGTSGVQDLGFRVLAIPTLNDEPKWVFLPEIVVMKPA